MHDLAYGNSIMQCFWYMNLHSQWTKNLPMIDYSGIHPCESGLLEKIKSALEKAQHVRWLCQTAR